jgi:hypothetical protein
VLKTYERDIMTGSMEGMLGLLLVIVLVITVFILVRRKHLSTPEARYQRDMRALQTSTYLRTEPRPARQSGADRLEHKYGGFGGFAGWS